MTEKSEPPIKAYANELKRIQESQKEMKELIENINTGKTLPSLSSLFTDEGAVEKAAVRAAKIVEDKIAHTEERIENLDKKATNLLRAIQDLPARIAILAESIAQPERAIENFKIAITEELKLQEARKLWSDSAARAKKAYKLSWWILGGLLIAVPVIAILQSTAIFGFFRAVGEAVLVDLPENATETAILIAAVSRLVLITLPVALYIWLIRIVVRFNMRSLLLMDDANQRNTMLETYLHLVEQDAGVKADRPLILEALFRRTPGHGPETIEPPNLADVLKLGSKPSAAGG